MNRHILEEAKKHSTIIQYGIGCYGRRCYFDLKNYSGKILYAVTDSSNGLNFYGHEVENLAYYSDAHLDALVIIAVGDQYRDEMKQYAIKLGFPNVYAPTILLDDYNYISENENFDLAEEIAEWYEVYIGHPIDMEHPRTFNEKIQWLKAYDSTPEKTRLADKLLVRDYIRDCLGEEYLIPQYGVWESFEEIDFDSLPEKFILKCTHASGTNKIVLSKSNIDTKEMRETFDDWIGHNYAYISGFEMHYKEITPRIIAEEYLETKDGVQIRDYKVHVFDGHAKLIQVDIDRSTDHRRNLYTTEWKYLPYSILYPSAPEISIERPECLDELIKAAEKLGKGFIYVRCDFYILDNRIYFGEMTFTHGTGKEPFDPEQFNIEMGSWMHLPIGEDPKN